MWGQAGSRGSQDPPSQERPEPGPGSSKRHSQKKAGDSQMAGSSEKAELREAAAAHRYPTAPYRFLPASTLSQEPEAPVLCSL